MGGIFDNIIAAMFIHMYLHQWSVVSKKVSSFFDVVIFDRYAKVWQHDCDQHVNFCYLNYLLTQVHNRNFFLYNLSFHTVNSSDWTLKKEPFPILPSSIARNP